MSNGRCEQRRSYKLTGSAEQIPEINVVLIKTTEGGSKVLSEGGTLMRVKGEEEEERLTDLDGVVLGILPHGVQIVIHRRWDLVHNVADLGSIGWVGPLNVLGQVLGRLGLSLKNLLATRIIELSNLTVDDAVVAKGGSER